MIGEEFVISVAAMTEDGIVLTQSPPTPTIV
jgi:hypothetical protein